MVLVPGGVLTGHRIRSAYQSAVNCGYVKFPCSSVYTGGRSSLHDCIFLTVFIDGFLLPNASAHARPRRRCKITIAPFTGSPRSFAFPDTLASAPKSKDG